MYLYTKASANFYNPGKPGPDLSELFNRWFSKPGGSNTRMGIGRIENYTIQNTLRLYGIVLINLSLPGLDKFRNGLKS